MQINVESYGMLKPLCGARTHVECDGDSITVEQVLARLCERCPELTPHLPATACAVGDEMVKNNHRLHGGDTLALLPPVSGG